MAKKKDIHTPSAVASLHMERPDDEPVTLDVDVRLTCSCGHVTEERKEVCALDDWAHVMCYRCGANYKVDIKSEILLACVATQDSEPVC